MPAVVTCEAVLFDMDGTLVDSTAVVERQWARWAARRRVDLAAVLAISHGRPTLETLSLDRAAVGHDGGSRSGGSDDSGG